MAVGKLVDAGDFCGRPEQRDGLWSHARQLEQLQQVGAAVFRQQFVAQGYRAALNDRLDRDGHTFANSLDRQQPCRVGRGLSQVHSRLLCRLRRSAVPKYAESLGAVDFKKIGGLLEDAGDGCVVHGNALRELPVPE